MAVIMQFLKKSRREKVDKKRQLIFVLLVFICSCNNNKYEMLSYLVAMKNYDSYDVSIKKVFVDPSYNFPYNVYIKVSVPKNSHEQLIKDLGLIIRNEIDTMAIKSLTNNDEYQLYFTMKSINKSRNSSLQEAEKNIVWWPQNFESTIFAGSYLDTGKERKPVWFNQKRNGRIVASIKGDTIYFLIECWG
jgi:hypothetical protein